MRYEDPRKRPLLGDKEPPRIRVPARRAGRRRESRYLRADFVGGTRFASGVLIVRAAILPNDVSERTRSPNEGEEDSDCDVSETMSPGARAHSGSILAVPIRSARSALRLLLGSLLRRILTKCS